MMGDDDHPAKGPWAKNDAYWHLHATQVRQNEVQQLFKGRQIQSLRVNQIHGLSDQIQTEKTSKRSMKTFHHYDTH